LHKFLYFRIGKTFELPSMEKMYCSGDYSKILLFQKWVNDFEKNVVASSVNVPDPDDF
jgi:hypothetical protein